MTIEEIKICRKMGGDIRYLLCQYFLNKVWDTIDTLAYDTVFEDGQIREVHTQLEAEYMDIEGLSENQPWNIPLMSPPVMVGSESYDGQFRIDCRTARTLFVNTKITTPDEIFDVINAMAISYGRWIIKAQRGLKIYTVPKLPDTNAAYDICDGLYVKLRYRGTPEFEEYEFSTMFLVP